MKSGNPRLEKKVRNMWDNNIDQKLNKETGTSKKVSVGGVTKLAEWSCWVATALFSP